MWGARHLLVDHAAYLAQLLHQGSGGLEPAGGVDDHQVAPARLGGVQGIEHHGTRIGALVVADDLAPGALSPHLELLGGGGPVGVARGQHHRPALRGELRGELADRRRLPAPVHPHDQEHAGALVGRREVEGAVGLTQESPHRVVEQGPEDGRVALAGAERPTEGVEEALGGRHADVGREEHVLQVFEEVFVDRLTPKQTIEGLGERGTGAAQPIAEGGRETNGLPAGRVCRVGVRDLGPILELGRRLRRRASAPQDRAHEQCHHQGGDQPHRDHRPHRRRLRRGRVGHLLVRLGRSRRFRHRHLGRRCRLGRRLRGRHGLDRARVDLGRLERLGGLLVVHRILGVGSHGMRCAKICEQPGFGMVTP